MLFTLEALDALHGDSLLLHYGTRADPGLIVIDGGPQGVYRHTLHPRLEWLRKDRYGEDGQLPIRLLMVSHIDDDHVNGVLELVNALGEEDGAKPYEITTLWFNSFDGILGHLQNEIAAEYAEGIRAASMEESLPADFGGDHHTRLILANVPQGRNLRSEAMRQGLNFNEGFGGGLIKRPPTGKKQVGFEKGLTFTVLGPGEERLHNLGTEWDTFKEKKAQGAAKPADFVDNSVFNLSSIVVLAEAGGKSMLLTGDARGDDILLGLESAGLMSNGTFHCDVLKMPHHGSWRDMADSFLTTVTADHYVISANGKYDNPDYPTMEALTRLRGDAPITIHLTNPLEEFVPKYDAEKLKQLLAKDKAAGKPYRVVFRENNYLSISIDLGDETLEAR